MGYLLKNKIINVNKRSDIAKSDFISVIRKIAILLNCIYKEEEMGENVRFTFPVVTDSYDCMFISKDLKYQLPIEDSYRLEYLDSRLGNSNSIGITLNDAIVDKLIDSGEIIDLYSKFIGEYTGNIKMTLKLNPTDFCDSSISNKDFNKLHTLIIKCKYSDTDFHDMLVDLYLEARACGIKMDKFDFPDDELEVYIVYVLDDGKDTYCINCNIDNIRDLSYTLYDIPLLLMNEVLVDLRENTDFLDDAFGFGIEVYNIVDKDNINDFI